MFLPFIAHMWHLTITGHNDLTFINKITAGINSLLFEMLLSPSMNKANFQTVSCERKLTQGSSSFSAFLMSTTPPKVMMLVLAGTHLGLLF